MNNNNKYIDYEKKYIKYKNKYIKLKNQHIKTNQIGDIIKTNQIGDIIKTNQIGDIIKTNQIGGNIIKTSYLKLPDQPLYNTNVYNRILYDITPLYII